MMTKFLANSFSSLLELIMWLFILAGTGGGIGAEFSGIMLLDGLIGFVIAAVFCALLFGPILMLVEIKGSVFRIEDLIKQRNRINSGGTRSSDGISEHSFNAID